MKAMLAAMIEAAPIKSRRCGRSKRGSRRSRDDVMASAVRPSGILSQKIADQWTYCAMNPPSAGPHAPDVV